MARGVTVDYFGKAGSGLNATASEAGATNENATATDARGDIVAQEAYNTQFSPSVTYDVNADTDIAALFSLGELIDGSANQDIVLTGFSVTTAAGAKPTVELSGESVPTGSVEGYTYTTPAQTLLKASKAQVLFSCGTLTGTGCHINGCSATGQVEFVDGKDEDGVRASWDIAGATIEVTLDIVQTGATAPTFTPAANWVVTKPLNATGYASGSQTNTGYETYSTTVRYIPTAVAPA